MASSSLFAILTGQPDKADKHNDINSLQNARSDIARARRDVACDKTGHDARYGLPRPCDGPEVFQRKPLTLFGCPLFPFCPPIFNDTQNP